MIRPFTCVCMILAAGSGLYVYQTKHRSQMLDREIARTLRAIDTTRERTGVLRGEWALLNEPERLAELSRNHLALQTLAPTQFVSLADLGARLPAPLPAGSVTMPPDDAPPERPVPIAQAPIRPLSPPAALAAPSAPAQVASALPPAPPKPAKPVVVAAKPPPPAEAPQKPGGHITAPIVSVAAAPIGGASNWIGESVMRAARARTGGAVAENAPIPAPRAYAAPAPAPFAAPAPAPFATPAAMPVATPFSAPSSVLGGSRSALPPPVPFR